MEQLDLVYNTFANLEKNYAKSTKSRSEYVNDKFGGDISTAMFLILNALSAEEFTDPEDIRKFSEIRNIFDKIKENKDRLDALKSFNFEGDSEIESAEAILSAGQQEGTGIQVLDQSELYKSGALHYVVKTGDTLLVPLCLQPGAANPPLYVKLFSNGMLTLFSQLCPDVSTDLCAVLKRKQLGLKFTRVSRVTF